MADEQKVQLQLHLAPREPIEISELTGALGSLGRQYQIYVDRELKMERGSTARLLVSSVAPGSIDVGLLPEIQNALATAAPIVSQIEVVTGFAKHVKSLVDTFRSKGETKAPSSASEVSVRDCDDAINIVKPIAEHGGTQIFNIYNGPVVTQVFEVGASQARSVVEEAIRTKAILQFPEAERRQRVSMVWKRIDSASAKIQGSSPDKVIIEEIDPKPKPVFFTDELSYLKRNMIQDEIRPFWKVYFVDVEVSRVAGRVTAYRVVGFHGTDDIEESGQEAEVI